ncbi:hypothetical protein NJB1907f44_36720 [Mycobacterium marinum]|nr:hypothetical protein NJB1907f34b_00120 [Mycobacterium marinum]GJN97451.1 hypothetical protein NJB1907E8_47430 [Mycobacterium marinum]GJO09326.1 hypothetical protein NJB1808e29_43360 [Mycobacterium marinum]GJO11611.1 hypothetical protein NJB1907E90_32220 [Mycobacterium marinum]GJO15670.1 hypothetical protein NJB1728e18_08290 [Mycobacterium marinum]
MAPALAGGEGCQLLRSGWSVVVGGVLSQGRRRDPATASGADNLQRPGSRQHGHAGTTAEFTTTGRPAMSCPTTSATARLTDPAQSRDTVIGQRGSDRTGARHPCTNPQAHNNAPPMHHANQGQPAMADPWRNTHTSEILDLSCPPTNFGRPGLPCPGTP